MKKIYLFLLAVFTAGMVNAQINVTFQVNMANETVGVNGVSAAGNWQDEDGGGNEWTPGDSPMSDTDLDGIWTLTVSIPAGTYEYKFINGNDWGNNEGAFTACGTNTNRSFTSDVDIVLPAICYNRCVPCGYNGLKVSVAEAPSADMHVGGDYTDPQFTVFTALSDLDANDIYDGLIAVPDFYDEVQYRFSNGNNIDGSGYEVPSGACINLNGNRTYTFPNDGDFVASPVVWETCNGLAVAVTAQVDMSTYCFDGEPDVRLMGPLNGLGDEQWSTGLPMSDANTDGIYEVTVNPSPGTYAYKFRVGTDGWEGYPGDRLITVEADTPIEIPVYCFGAIEPGNCAPGIAPSDVTFEATPGVEVIPAGQKMWIFGDFTGYQGGALAMDDTDADGIWSVTVPALCPVSVLYKFAIGLDNLNTAENWLEEGADFSAIGGCGVDNGDFSDNRILTRESADPITVCYTFNTCLGCASGLNENALNNSVSIFPNPFSTQTVVKIDNKDGIALSMNILDVTGKEVKTLTNILNNTATIDSKGMSSGVYFLQIFNDKGQKAVKKLIVQ